MDRPQMVPSSVDAVLMITSTCKGSAWLQQDKYHKGTVYYYFFII